MEESSLQVSQSQSQDPTVDSNPSSATEGPDSPDVSPSSSPVPMMLPSDSPGSDFPAPRYSVKFTDNVTKDGDVIQYTVNVRKIHQPGEIVTLVRDYEDLQVRVNLNTAFLVLTVIKD